MVTGFGESHTHKAKDPPFLRDPGELAMCFSNVVLKRSPVQAFDLYRTLCACGTFLNRQAEYKPSFRTQNRGLLVCFGTHTSLGVSYIRDTWRGEAAVPSCHSHPWVALAVSGSLSYFPQVIAVRG